MHRRQIEKDNVEVKALFSQLSQLYRAGYQADYFEGDVFPSSSSSESSNNSEKMYQKWFKDIDNGSALHRSLRSFTASQSESDIPPRSATEKLGSLLFAGCQYGSSNYCSKVIESDCFTFKNEVGEANENGLNIEMLLSFLNTSGFLPLQILLECIPGIDVVHQNASYLSPFLESMSYLDSIGKGLSSTEFSSNICSTLLMKASTSNNRKSFERTPCYKWDSNDRPNTGGTIKRTDQLNTLTDDCKSTDDYENTETIDPSVQLFIKLQQFCIQKQSLNMEGVIGLLSPVFPSSPVIDAAISYLQSQENLTVCTEQLNGLPPPNIVTSLPYELNMNSELLPEGSHAPFVTTTDGFSNINICSSSSSSIEGGPTSNPTGSIVLEKNVSVEGHLAEDTVVHLEGVSKSAVSNSTTGSPSAFTIKEDKAAHDHFEKGRSGAPSFEAPLPLLLFPRENKPYDVTPNDTSGAMALLALMTDCVCTSEFDSCFSKIDSTPYNASILPERIREGGWILDKKRKLIEDNQQDIVMKRQQRCPRCREFKKGHICIYDVNTDA